MSPSAASSVLSGWEPSEESASWRSGSPAPPCDSDEEGDASVTDSEGSEKRASQPPPSVSMKRTKANLRIASENVRGRGAQTIGASLKWKKIADDMRRLKIGVMAVQETHLSESHVEEIQDLYRHLKVFNTSLPSNPTGAGGVALVFNTLLTNTERVKPAILEPGRAIMATFEWHRGRMLTVLAVYASTEQRENEELWETLHTKLSATRIVLPKPDVVLGDFNFVEDAVDRFPAKMSRMDGPQSFKDLRRLLRLKDGWREMNPGKTDWTWRDPQRRHMSRIDRMYVSEALLAGSREWTISLSGITKDDHSRIEAVVYALDGPDVGQGRWAMKDTITRDEEFLRTVNGILTRARGEMDSVDARGRTPAENIQRVWAKVKVDIRAAARKRTTEINCRRNRRLVSLTAEKEEIVAKLGNTVSAEDDPGLSSRLREVEDKLYGEKARAHRWTFLTRAARAWAEGETMSKSWFSWPRDRRKREEIPYLTRPGQSPPTLVTSGVGMAALAMEYHDGVQQKDLEVDPAERASAIDEALRSVRCRVRAQDMEELRAAVSGERIARAIREAKTGKAAGTDGIIHELWKALDAKYRAQKGPRKEWADVAGLIARVFRDVEEHGVDGEAGLTEGWMCPLYKKGERSDISNYRPITLLNTDYKLYTKTLATRLAVVAQYLVHPSQAGFVRGRSITDHIKVTTLMLDHAEAMEEDGAIVALDQEKAYDRVRHDYLLAALRNLEFPEEFVNRVGSLYETAFTRVMINGHLSEPYRVTRGVTVTVDIARQRGAQGQEGEGRARIRR